MGASWVDGGAGIGIDVKALLKPVPPHCSPCPLVAAEQPDHEHDQRQHRIQEVAHGISEYPLIHKAVILCLKNRKCLRLGQQA